MSDQTWDELALLTAKLEKLTGERTIARAMGNEPLRSHCQAQIDELLRRRGHLVDKLTNYHSAPKAQNQSLGLRAY